MALKNLMYQDIKDELITIKYWKKVLKVIEAYYDEESIKTYNKDRVFSVLGNHFKVSIPDYFEYQKKEKYLPMMSLITLSKIWFAISQMRGLSIRQFPVVASIGGSNVFGGGNTLEINKDKTLDLSKITIRRDFTPLYVDKSKMNYEDRWNISFEVTLKDIKDFIDKNQKKQVV